MVSDDFIKYPKTHSIDKLEEQGLTVDSLVQAGQLMVVEEKMDGTQVGVSFDENDQLRVQSRGQFIGGSPEFSLLKSWCWEHSNDLLALLGQRYILFGEWLYAKHTLFYDSLPDYLMEFDVFDRYHQYFLSTHARQCLLKPYDFIHSVDVIDVNDGQSIVELQKMIGQSSFVSDLTYSCLNEEVKNHTDTTGLMEGLYIKVEGEYEVLGRYKLVRSEFIEKIASCGVHWKSRRIINNIVRLSQ